MYTQGFFSAGAQADPWRVDAAGLGARERNERPRARCRVDAQNAMDGLAGRAALLSNLGLALAEGGEYFGADARAGNLVGA